MKFTPITSHRPECRTILKRLVIPIIIAICVFKTSVTHAGSSIAGGSGILTQSGADQLAAWLGEGDLALTDIFSHTSGDGKTSLDFHGAADGMGRTFSVLRVTNVNGTASDLIVGGYNPHSWNSSNSTYFANALSDRTAFLFNLSAGTKNPERLDSGGEYQTGNYSTSGPDFGGGDDLQVNTSLDDGYANAYSYTGQLIGGVRSISLTFSHLDVFTITPVPEPSTALLGAIGLAGILSRRFRNGRNACAPMRTGPVGSATLSAGPKP